MNSEAAMARRPEGKIWKAGKQETTCILPAILPSKLEFFAAPRFASSRLRC
jgi:hypothetical protein